MQLRFIQIFHTVMQHSTLNAAAERLHTSQPALSVAIRQMEDRLGYQLFHRHKRRLVPTRFAEELFPHACLVMDHHDNFIAVASRLKQARTEEVVIGVVPALSFDIMPVVLRRFRALAPHSTVRVLTIRTDDAYNHLLRKEIDLAIIFAVEDDTPRDTFIHPVPLVNVSRVSHGGDGATENLLVDISRSGPIGKIVQDAVQSGYLDARRQIVVDSYHAAVSMVIHAGGYTIVDALTAAAFRNHPITSEPFPAKSAVCLRSMARPGEEPTPSLLKLKRMIHDELALALSPERLPHLASVAP